MKLGKTVKFTQDVISGMGVGILWDSEQRGLYARRRVLGGPIRFGLKYRFEGQQRWLAFPGMYTAPWDANSARKEARRRFGELANGVDPARRRAAARDMPTLKDFCEDRYIPDHVDVRLKAATAEKMRPRIRRRLFPPFGSKRLDQIELSQVHKWHASLSKTPTEANRCLSLLRHILNAAELWQVINWAKTPGGYNPTRGIKKYREQPRRVFLNAEQLAALGASLRKLETVGLPGPIPPGHEGPPPLWANPTAANLFRLSLLTGARPGAIKGLRHEWVSLEEGVIRIPDGKTGFQVIAMPPAARELYARIPRIRAVPWVFPVRGLNHIVNIWDAWDRVRRDAKLGDVQPHDLRHTFASVAVAGKESLYMVQQLLGHASPATTQRYAHMSLDPLQEASSRVAATISEALAAPRNWPS